MLQRGRPSATNVALFPAQTALHRVPPPTTLNQTERKRYIEIVQNAGPNHFTKNDEPLIKSYVQTLELLDHYAKKARDNPAFAKAHNQTAKTVIMFARQLRLTPRSRITPRSAGRMARQHTNVSAYEQKDD